MDSGSLRASVPLVTLMLDFQKLCTTTEGRIYTPQVVSLLQGWRPGTSTATLVLAGLVSNLTCSELSPLAPGGDLHLGSATRCGRTLEGSSNLNLLVVGSDPCPPFPKGARTASLAKLVTTTMEYK